MDRKKIAIEFAKSLNHPEIEKVILFGSVARGEDTKDSDVDILVITKNSEDDLKIEDDIYGKTFDILLETGEYLSVKIRSIEHYQKHIHFPFYSNIEKEGILIGWKSIINKIFNLKKDRISPIWWMILQNQHLKKH